MQIKGTGLEISFQDSKKDSAHLRVKLKRNDRFIQSITGFNERIMLIFLQNYLKHWLNSLGNSPKANRKLNALEAKTPKKYS